MRKADFLSKIEEKWAKFYFSKKKEQLEDPIRLIVSQLNGRILWQETIVMEELSPYFWKSFYGGSPDDFVMYTHGDGFQICNGPNRWDLLGLEDLSNELIVSLLSKMFEEAGKIASGQRKPFNPIPDFRGEWVEFTPSLLGEFCDALTNELVWRHQQREEDLLWWKEQFEKLQNHTENVYFKVQGQINKADTVDEFMKTFQDFGDALWS